MQNDKDLFDLIKEVHSLRPRPEFVDETSMKLTQLARGIARKRKMKRISLTSFGIVASSFALSWLFFFGGAGQLQNQMAFFTKIASPEPLVYIYQTHDLESFASETKKNDADLAYHDTRNITLVGEKLKQSLERRGIPSIHDKTEVSKMLKEKNLSFGQSYDISRDYLEEAVAKYGSFKMVIDLHRDSQPGEVTTARINEENYAKVVFVISGASPNSQENLELAKLLHSKLEGEFPGLSRGVIFKNNTEDQHTYNQDVLDGSVLVEIGGFENTLEEEYRSVDVLAEVIEEVLEE